MCKEIRDFYFKKLKTIKNNLGINFTEMSKIIGIHKGSLYNNFNRKCFPVEKTHKLILSKFNINPNFFFFDDEEIFNKTNVVWSKKTYNQKIKEIYYIYGVTQPEFSQKISRKNSNLLYALKGYNEASFVVLFELVHTLGINPAFFYFDNEVMFKKQYISNKRIDNNFSNEWLINFEKLNLLKADFKKNKDDDYKTYIAITIRKRLSKKMIGKNILN